MAIEIVEDIRENPDVVVTFSGLLMLRFDSKSQHCKVGVVKAAEDHDHHLNIKVELLPRKTEKPEWEYSGPLKDNLKIEVSGPVTSGVCQYKYKPDEPLDRKPGVKSMKLRTKRDYRWVLNFKRFHEAKLRVTPQLFKRCIQLDNGLFYASKLFKPKHDRLVLKRGKSWKHWKEHYELLGIANDTGANYDPAHPYALPINTIAELIRANIYLEESGEVQLRWGKQSAPIFPPLKKPEPGSYYKITFDNTCSKAIEARREGKEISSDLPEYYKVIQNVPIKEQLDLDDPDSGTSAYPCVPGDEGP